jgi:signal transduction histidine kinase/CheY-like chemotaxis protein
MAENTQKKYIIRIIMTMFGLLMVAIVFNAALLVVRLNRAMVHHMINDANTQLALVQTLHNQQIDKNAIITSIVREQNQKVCDFLDYDNVEALSYMLKTIATLHSVDMVLLYDENEQLITTYPAGSDISDHSIYKDLLKPPANWNGVGLVDRIILKDQKPELFALVKDPKIFCFQASVDLLHDTGDIYGRVVLIQFLHGNPSLKEKMASLSEVEVIYYNQFFQPVWSTLPSDVIPFPQQNRIQVEEKTYLVVHHAIRNYEGKTVGYLAAALVEGPLIKQRNQVIIYSLLPLLVASVISLIIFFLLKRRVFNKIRTLSGALRRVTQSRTDFSIRIPTPIADDIMPRDEVVSMAIDFNQMMAKLEDTYNQMLAAQKEVENANRKLEARVKQRTAELSLTNKNLRAEIAERQRAEKERRQLEQQLQRAHKMEAIGTLAGGVAHDLNNILSGIVSYPELIMLSLPDDSPIRNRLEAIHKSGLKAAAIVQDLLALARRGVFEPKVTNLNEIIREYLASPEFLNLKMNYPAVRVETHLDEELFNIFGSAVHLTKVIMNLVSNGFESIGNKGRLIIRTTNTYVDRPFRGYDQVNEGDYVQLSISDSGGGIDDADINQIFEPFFSRKKMGRSGSGLGLTVVWASIKDHDGYIDIQSHKDEGTTFQLYFPMTDRLPTNESEIAIDGDYCGNGEHILVVDDVSEQLDIAGGLLKSLGYRVSTASSGEKAVKFVHHTSVDVLLLDMIMDPGIDGLETYRRVLKQCPGQKAIIASGFAESDKVKAALALGAAKFIKKPYSLKEIALAVRTALDT